jgi:hypothetical protein
MSGTVLASTPQKATTGCIALASMIGVTIELYDFFTYGTAAALALGQVFFPATGATADATKRDEACLVEQR